MRTFMRRIERQAMRCWCRSKQMKADVNVKLRKYQVWLFRDVTAKFCNVYLKLIWEGVFSAVQRVQVPAMMPKWHLCYDPLRNIDSMCFGYILNCTLAIAWSWTHRRRSALQLEYVRANVTSQPFSISINLSIHDESFGVSESCNQFHKFGIDIGQPPSMIPRKLKGGFQCSIDCKFERVHVIRSFSSWVIHQIDKGPPG